MVYVDDYRAPYRGMIMCHMAADSRAELFAMAEKIGLRARWIQASGTWKEHFDVSLTKRSLAVQAGAVEVDSKKLVRVMRDR